MTDKDDVHRRTPIAESYHHGDSNSAESHSDGHILKEIRSRLANDGEEDPAHLDIRVERGRVELYGMVESEMAKLSIANICDGVAGVTAVINHLKVGA